MDFADKDKSILFLKEHGERRDVVLYTVLAWCLTSVTEYVAEGGVIDVFKREGDRWASRVADA